MTRWRKMFTSSRESLGWDGNKKVVTILELRRYKSASFAEDAVYARSWVAQQYRSVIGPRIGR